jgi:hypothetical protein
MSIFENKDSIRAESFKEVLTIAKYCVETRKTKKDHPKYDGGIYGYPAVILLLPCIDSMGKYLADKKYKVTVDEKEVKIKADKRFLVLNSNYFGLNLSELEMECLYKKFRNNILHEVILEDVILTAKTDEDIFKFKDVKAVEISKKKTSVEGGVEISVPNFYKLCEKAITTFLEEHFNEVERVSSSAMLEKGIELSLTASANFSQSLLKQPLSGIISKPSHLS